MAMVKAASTLAISLLVLASGVPLSVEAQPRAVGERNIEAERRAIQDIEKTLYGRVVYDFEEFDGANPPDVRPDPALIDRLFRSANPADIPNVVFVQLLGDMITDDDLLLLRDLRSLEGLAIRSRYVTDSGLQHITHLENLHHLWLVRVSVTGTGLAHIASMPELRSLNLGGAPITDHGIALLRNHPSLRNLIVNSPHVTDDGVPHLAAIPQLETLSIAGTAITGSGLQHLKSCEHLTGLSLDRQLTEVGISNLKELHGLRDIWINELYIKPEQERELMAALPNLTINKWRVDL